MVTRQAFRRGDIVMVGFDPSSGHEQKGSARPAVVISPFGFNQLGMTLVAPVTQGGNYARYAGFSVMLDSKQKKIQGVVLLNQLRMLDLQARAAKKVDTATDEVMQELLLRVQAIVE
jgi:mRNA interferase ChpB